MLAKKLTFTAVGQPIKLTKHKIVPMRIQTQRPFLPELPFNVFKFPTMVYGPSITTATASTTDRSSVILEQNNTVSADPRLLLQTWSDS